MVEPRKFKPKKPKFDTGVRTPDMGELPCPEKTHRDAAVEAKRLAERDRLWRDPHMDPVEKAERMNALDRETILPETEDDGEEQSQIT